MKKISVLIEGTNKVITLDEAILINSNNPHILVKKATVFWNYDNIVTSVNNELTYNVIKKTIEQVYWTFNMLKKEIEGYGTVTLEANEYDGTYSITSDNVINVKNFGPILGFNKDQVIRANTKTKSGGPVNIKNGLEYIEVPCNLVRMSDNINTNGKRSDIMSTLPITTTQTLKGSVQHYFDIESRVPIFNGVVNRIEFNVTKNVGNVLLELYIM